MSTATDLVPTGNAGGGGAMTEVATGRVVQEVQAAMTVAKRFPRDETAAAERIRKACTRSPLAEQAIYQYPRGGTKVEGPSIRLAEVMAQNWGNLDFGITEIEQRDDESDVMAYCWDLETNTRQTKIFTVPHARHTKQGVQRLTDPRDVYENVANMGARRMRACILGVIPGDIADLAVEQCAKTMAGGSKDPIEDRVRKTVAAFAAYGVTPEMLEARVGYKLEAIDEHGLAGLRRIGLSLKDGMSKREDWFDVKTAEAVEGHEEQARQKRQTAEPDPEPPPNPPTSEEVKADQAQLTEEFSGQLTEATTAGRVAELSTAIGKALNSDAISVRQANELRELEAAAKDRLSKR